MGSENRRRKVFLINHVNAGAAWHTRARRGQMAFLRNTGALRGWLRALTKAEEAQGLMVAREVDEVSRQRLAATLYLQR